MKEIRLRASITGYEFETSRLYDEDTIALLGEDFIKIELENVLMSGLRMKVKFGELEKIDVDA